MPRSNVSPPTRTLIEVCEPFFSEVCNLIRRASYGGSGDSIHRERDRLMGMLSSVRATAEEGGARLWADYGRIEPVLAYFADDVIMNSPLSFADDWRGSYLLASDERINVRDGQERFFMELDATMKEAPTESAERLAVFHQCLGLGFCGIHRQDPDRLRQYSEEALRRLDTHGQSGTADERVCEEAYVVDQREFFRPVAEKVMAMAVLLVALMAIVVVGYLGTAYAVRAQLRTALDPVLALETRTNMPAK